jgi:hypothetical protein
MNLNNFESYIDKKIIARGYVYYENDYVTSVEEIDDNVYEAEVEGTDLYTVEVELDDEANIVDTGCDCPYDMGEYCKHQVAVFLALRNTINAIPDEKNHVQKGNNMDAKAVHKPLASKKIKTSNIEKILYKRTKDELIKLLLDIASEHEEIKQRIELHFDDGNDEDEITKSISLIRTFIRNNSERDDFVTYRDVYEAVRGTDLVMKKARQAFVRKKFVHASDLALCVIHEMMDLLAGADDSDGVIEGVIEENFTFISEIIDDEELCTIHKESIFNKLIEEAENRRYNGWTDWRLDLLEKCSELAENQNFRNKLENHLVSMTENEKGDLWSVNYFAERVNLIRYHMVKEHDGQKKALQFIEQNLQYSGFRKMAIEGAMEKKDYDYVIQLTLDGEEKDKNFRGLIDDWKKYRYKAFQLAGKLDEQRKIAIDFILDGSFEYYKELKNTYDSNEWHPVCSKIILLLETQKKIYNDVYTRILIEEGEKQKLLEFVKGSPSSVERFYKYLIPEYKQDVYELFLQYIEQAAARASSRNAYQGVCAIIRNLKKAGGKEQALEIIQKLFYKYVKRPAFRDELTRV